MARFLLGLAAITSVLACPEHSIENLHPSRINKRATNEQDWAYEASYNWGMINSNYTLCQTGTQQSPIQLLLTQGLSTKHIPTFNYSTPITGDLFNWGYGPAFTLNSTDIKSHPSLSFDNETIYLLGWHIHAPADHSVQGDRSKAELHLVHGDTEGNYRGVVAIRIDPGNKDSPFFQQFIEAANPSDPTPTPTPSGSPPSNSSTPEIPIRRRATTPGTTSSFPNFDSSRRISMEMDAGQALNEVNMFSDFWTYSGSLTSPPCKEGIRFWVARNILFVGNAQMQEILAVSTYSARVEQEVWLHGINA